MFGRLVMGFVLALSLGSLRAASSELPDVDLGQPIVLTLSGNREVRGTLMKVAQNGVTVRTESGERFYASREIVSAKRGPAARGADPVVEEEERGGVRIGPAKEQPAAKNEFDLKDLLQPEAAPKPAPAAPATPKKPNAEDPRNRTLPTEIRFDGKNLPEPFKAAMRNLQARSYALAIGDLKTLFEKGQEAEVKAADEYCRLTLSQSLPELLTFLYLSTPCQTCSAKGIATCKLCMGTGYGCRFVEHVKGGGGPTPGTRRGSQKPLTFTDPETGGVEHRVVTICNFCRGNGYEACQTCFATRRQFHNPTPREALVYADALLKLADEVLALDETDYAKTGSDEAPAYRERDTRRMNSPLPQAWIRDSANRVKSNIMRMWRAEKYVREAMRVDPLVEIRHKRDLIEELTRISYRRLHLIGELTERQQIYAQNRSERFLDEMNYSENFSPSGSERARFGEILGDE
ncbi:MAG: hypothetical protein M5U26_09790 [Planctomycetota bacterium]|nr:hypothetical protein [Planctomycetota bacterium]